MKRSIELPIEAIRGVCRRYEVDELDLFGSALREDFRPDSDVDMLVTFREGADLGPWMSRYFELEEELSRLVGRRVDLVMRRGLERDVNTIRRNQILSTAEPIFVAR